MLLILFTLVLIIVTIQVEIVTIENTNNTIKQKEQKKFIKINSTSEVLPF